MTRDKVVEDYLKDLITKFDSYSFKEEENGDLGKFITQKLLRKKFRKQKVHENTASDISKKVFSSLEKNIPFHFVIPFGGYKHFWNPSHPEPDWAEIFTLKFFTDWVSPILSVHKPGAIIEFISEDLILTTMNNYPEKSLNKYSEIFSHLIATFQKYSPENLEYRFFRMKDKYDQKKIIEEVEKLLPERWKNWEKYSDQEKGAELKRSRRSVFWKGDMDLTKLTNREKEKKIIESRLIQLAFYDVEARPEFLGDYFMRENHVPICFSFGLSPDNIDNWIRLGSTYASTVDYWVGRGILEESKGGFVNRIVSKKQYKKIKDKLKKVDLSDDVSPFNNYKLIEIIKDQDWIQIS